MLSTLSPPEIKEVKWKENNEVHASEKVNLNSIKKQKQTSKTNKHLLRID